jgi:hypothetical protein
LSQVSKPSHPVRVLAIGAVLAIAFVVAWRLRHPIANLAVLGIAVSLCILIWTQRGPERN